MAAPTTITDLSVTAASNGPDGASESPNVIDDYQRALGAIIRRTQSQGAAVSSASTTNIGATTDGEYVHITGTTTINSFGTVAAGITRRLVFDDALTLTHSASLIMPGAVSFTTAAGDAAEFVSEGSGVWRCLNISRYAPLTAASQAEMEAGTETALRSMSPVNVSQAIVALSFSVVGIMRNLVGSSPGSAKTATWTADELVAETVLGGITYKGESLSLSFNGATTGANGMDTGATPTSSDLYIYAIYNPTTSTWATLGTIAGNGAAVYGGSNLPSGYTASALIWSGVTNGSGQIGAMSQQDWQIAALSASALSGGSATSYTSVSISSIVPANAKFAIGDFGAAGSDIYLASTSAGIGQIRNSSSASGVVCQFKMMMSVSQTVYYKVASGAAGSITVSGYTI
jgi:hypothetical protein